MQPGSALLRLLRCILAKEAPGPYLQNRASYFHLCRVQSVFDDSPISNVSCSQHPQFETHLHGFCFSKIDFVGPTLTKTFKLSFNDCSRLVQKTAEVPLHNSLAELLKISPCPLFLLLLQLDKIHLLQQVTTPLSRLHLLHTRFCSRSSQLGESSMRLVQKLQPNGAEIR